MRTGVLVALTITCFTTGLTGAVAQRERGGRGVDLLPAGVPLAEVRFVQIRDEAGTEIARGEFVNCRAALQGDAAGLARIEIANVGIRLRQGIRVALDRIPPSATYRLLLDGTEIATFRSGGNGRSSLAFAREDDPLSPRP